MNSKKISLVSGILCVLTIGCALESDAYPQALYMGTIQFPKILEKAPQLRIYCQGHKILSESSDELKRISFCIPGSKDRKEFTILITDSIEYATEENTIKYLKIAHTNPNYKLYKINLIKKEEMSYGGEDKEKNPAEINGTTHYSWKVEALRFPKQSNGRIPDDTIIICYDADYVDRLEGGSEIELPRIMIKNDILSIVGSEDKLHDASSALVLSSLDLDTFHRNINKEIKLSQKKTLIALRA